MEIAKLPLWDEFDPAKASAEQKVAFNNLTAAFDRFRTNAAHLAQETARFLPDLTVHDVTHLDALWQLAREITGTQYPINPVELFVLGGAFLLHDSAMSLSAYPGGWDDIRATTVWQDLESAHLRSRGDEALAEADREIVLQQFLRLQHATQAETLATCSWTAPDTGQALFLIEDVELRHHYGPLIGALAHSHWWDHTELEPKLSQTLGASKSMPPAWTVDPVKLACLLRCADAIHLDARRAPRFLFALRKPQLLSHHHWLFQSRLGKPIAKDGRILLTSGMPFEEDAFDAWWLAFQAVQTAQSEIEWSNDLLTQRKVRSFSVHGVHGSESPSSFARHVPTKGWLPVSMNAHVSSPATILEYFGGRQIYGDWPDVAFRELIQNAADAIRARRVLSPGVPGRIVFRVTRRADERLVVSIEDNGIGMSRYVVEHVLLDLGHSLWNDTPTLMRELPKLSSRWPGMDGRYGVGFFSVFTLGSDVSVTTRRYDQGYDGCFTVKFEHGLTGRPILTPAAREDVPPVGGTTVRIVLPKTKKRERSLPSSIFQLGAFMGASKTDVLGSLSDGRFDAAKSELARLCPALDADLCFSDEDSETTIVSADDWKTIDAPTLLARTAHNASKEAAKWITLVDDIQDSQGELVGRAAICPERFSSPGVVTAGGLFAARMRGFAGLLVGDPTRISRDEASTRANEEQLEHWARRQAESLLASKDFSDQEKSSASLPLVSHGASVTGFPLFQHGGQYYTAAELLKLFRSLEHDELLLCTRDSLDYEADEDEDIAKYDFTHFLEPAENLVLYPERYHLPGESSKNYWHAVVELLQDVGFELEEDGRHETVAKVNGHDVMRLCDVFTW